MITSDIIVVRPAAQNVVPGVALPAGPQGTSAYQLAGGDLVWGNVAAWLASLKSTTPGPPGITPDISGKLDKTGDASGTRARLDNEVDFNTAERLFKLRSVTDYYRSVDNGDVSEAIMRASRRGITRLGFAQVDSPFNFMSTFELPSANMCLIAEAPRTTELRLKGAVNGLGVVGNTSAMSYHFYMNDFLFTKEQQSNSGALLRLQNVGYWSFNGHRIYGDNKVWRVLDLISTIQGKSEHVKVEEILERAVSGKGSSAPPGNVGGPVFDTRFEDWYVYGCGSAIVDPTRDGAMVMEDYFQAIRKYACTIGKHHGAAFAMLGTSASKEMNILNFILDPNVESDYPGATIAILDYVASTAIGGSLSWCSTQGGVGGAQSGGILLTQNSNNNTVSGLQIGQAGIGSVGVIDNGIRNEVEGNQFIGYDTDADAALLIGPNARKGSYVSLTASQLKRVIVDQSPDTAGHVIKGFTYDAISGQPLTGLKGSTSSNKVITGIASLDAGYPVLPASTVITPPDKVEAIRINTAGTIQRITPSYFGQELTLFFEAAGTVLQRLQGAAGSGSVYLPDRGDFVSAVVPASMKLKFMGDYWWPMSIFN